MAYWIILYYHSIKLVQVGGIENWTIALLTIYLANNHPFYYSPGSSLKDHLEGLIYDEEGHPIAKKIVVVAINKDVSDMKEFFTPLLELVDSATIVIPMGEYIIIESLVTLVVVQETKVWLKLVYAHNALTFITDGQEYQLSYFICSCCSSFHLQ